ncbi:MAG: DUF6077 domain-containing protein [Clostridium sp.]|nr:DUF6077 domain-containing protein [Clostridium sp.]
MLLFVSYLFGDTVVYDEYNITLYSICMRIVKGQVILMSFFWICCLPVLIFNLNIIHLIYIFLTCIIAFSSIIFLFEIFITKKKIKFNIKLDKSSLYEILYLTMFVGVVIIQMYFIFFNESVSELSDEYHNIVLFLDSLKESKIYDVDLAGLILGNAQNTMITWPIYIAFLSIASGLDTATIIYTVIPAVFIVIAYMIYYLLAVKLFDKRENRLIFLLILAVLYLFGGFSSYSPTVALLLNLWQGHNIVFLIIIPLFIALIPNMDKFNINTHDIMWGISFSISACSLSAWGAVAMLIMSFIVLILLFVYKKKRVIITFFSAYCILPIVQLMLFLR